jgi:hypothetical protein
MGDVAAEVDKATAGADPISLSVALQIVLGLEGLSDRVFGSSLLRR